MNGSSTSFAMPAKARRTGKPSPSKPLGAVVSEINGRSWASIVGASIRGSVSVSAVTAGMVVLSRLLQLVAPATTSNIHKGIGISRLSH